VILDPKGPIGQDELSIIVYATFLMLIVVVPVIFLTFLFAWNYRASNPGANYTPNWEHSNKVAAFVVLAPCTIVLLLGITAWKSSHKLDPYRPLASNHEPVEVDVVALDWKWLFIYPKLGIAAVNEIAFPTDVPVTFNISSASVMNSFFIPQLGGQIYAMGGMQTKLSLIASQAGSYDGISAQYSGAGFSGMKFKALAMNQQGFENWIAKARLSPARLDRLRYTALSKPSQDHPVEYFSSADPQLFQEILREIRGEPARAAHLHGQ